MPFCRSGSSAVALLVCSRYFFSMLVGQIIQMSPFYRYELVVPPPICKLPPLTTYKLVTKRANEQQQNEPGRELPALRDSRVCEPPNGVQINSSGCCVNSSVIVVVIFVGGCPDHTAQGHPMFLLVRVPSAECRSREKGGTGGRADILQRRRSSDGDNGSDWGAAFVHKSLFVDEAHTCRR